MRTSRLLYMYQPWRRMIAKHMQYASSSVSPDDFQLQCSNASYGDTWSPKTMYAQYVEFVAQRMSGPWKTSRSRLGMHNGVELAAACRGECVMHRMHRDISVTVKCSRGKKL